MLRSHETHTLSSSETVIVSCSFTYIEAPISHFLLVQTGPDVDAMVRATLCIEVNINTSLCNENTAAASPGSGLLRLMLRRGWNNRGKPTFNNWNGEKEKKKRGAEWSVKNTF